MPDSMAQTSISVEGCKFKIFVVVYASVTYGERLTMMKNNACHSRRLDVNVAR